MKTRMIPLLTRFDTSKTLLFSLRFVSPFHTVCTRKKKKKEKKEKGNEKPRFHTSLLILHIYYEVSKQTLPPSNNQRHNFPRLNDINNNAITAPFSSPNAITLVFKLYQKKLQTAPAINLPRKAPCIIYFEHGRANKETI